MKQSILEVAMTCVYASLIVLVLIFVAMPIDTINFFIGFFVVAAIIISFFFLHKKLNSNFYTVVYYLYLFNFVFNIGSARTILVASDFERQNVIFRVLSFLNVGYIGNIAIAIAVVVCFNIIHWRRTISSKNKLDYTSGTMLVSCIFVNGEFIIYLATLIAGSVIGVIKKNLAVTTSISEYSFFALTNFILFAIPIIILAIVTMIETRKQVCI